MRVWMCMCKCTFDYVGVYVLECLNMCHFVWICVCVYICVCVNGCVYMCMHTFACDYVCVCK